MNRYPSIPGLTCEQAELEQMAIEEDAFWKAKEEETTIAEAMARLLAEAESWQRRFGGRVPPIGRPPETNGRRLRVASAGCGRTYPAPGFEFRQRAGDYRVWAASC